MESTRRLHARIIDYEAKLKRITPEFDTTGKHWWTWRELRHKIHLVHEEIMGSDPAFVRMSQVMGVFWRSMYHSLMETVRKSEEGKEWMKVILEEGVGFYSLLLLRLWSSLKPPVGSALRPALKINSASTDTITALIYECLLSLSDLRRYQASLAGNKSYFIHLAMQHAILATDLIPTASHAYNQLGIIQCDQDNLLRALNAYIRSAMAVEAIPEGLKNLLILGRRVIALPEDRMELARDPVHAAFLAVLTRLLCGGLLEELARGSQSAHLEMLFSQLVRLMAIPTVLSGEGDYPEDILDLCTSMVLAVELLNSQTLALGTGQIRMLTACQLS